MSLKLSQRERQAIEYCMSIESITLNKFIKSAIREKLHRYRDRINDIESNIVSENQLSLFPEEQEDITPQKEDNGREGIYSDKHS